VFFYAHEFVWYLWNRRFNLSMAYSDEKYNLFRPIWMHLAACMRFSQARWSRIGLDWTTAFRSRCGSHKPQITSRVGLGGTAKLVVFANLPSSRSKLTMPLHRRAIDAVGGNKLLHATLRIFSGTNSLIAREISPHYLGPALSQSKFAISPLSSSTTIRHPWRRQELPHQQALQPASPCATTLVLADLQVVIRISNPKSTLDP
jgi:hypothetical protein